MDKIDVKILDHNFNGMPLFLAKLTQRGHQISSMDDLLNLYDENIEREPSKSLLELPHTTIQRMCYMTIAIFGLSTKAVSQLRTHATRLTFISTSTQYSNFSMVDDAFVYPEYLIDPKGRDNYHCIQALNEADRRTAEAYQKIHDAYRDLVQLTGDQDSASYLLPQGLRKCLIVSGNYPSWQYVLQTRLCNRNTYEVQYICKMILAEMTRECGAVWADRCLPKCCSGSCPEGKFCCGQKYKDER